MLSSPRVYTVHGAPGMPVWILASYFEEEPYPPYRIINMNELEYTTFEGVIQSCTTVSDVTDLRLQDAAGKETMFRLRGRTYVEGDLQAGAHALVEYEGHKRYARPKTLEPISIVILDMEDGT